VVLVKFLEKNQNLHIQIGEVSLKMTSHRTMKKKKVEKNENPRFYGQNKLLFWHPPFQPLGNFGHVVAYRSSLKNTKK
jgi:hypothetical protein